MILRKNQINAIEISKENNYRSGIHYQATGTGKSYIGLKILLDFYKKEILKCPIYK